MKYISCILLVLIFSSFKFQINYPVAKLYAYQQMENSGANLSVNDKAVTKSSEHIYLLVKQNRNIQVESVWINGKSVNFKTEIIKSPVKVKTGISFSGKASEILVPETIHTVLQVFVDNKSTEDITPIPKRYEAYPLLIKYSEGNTTFYLGTKNWKTVAAKANQ